MSKKDIYRITVLKWEQHNPKRKKNYKYFLLANNLYLHPKIQMVSTSARWAYIVLLMMCSDANNETITCTERALNEAITCRLGASNVLDQLQSIQLVTYTKNEILRIEKNRIEKNRMNNPDLPKKPKSGSVSFDFNAMYQKYPRKEGKTKGLEKCKVQVKTKEDFDLLSLAIEKYTNHCKDKEPRFIKHFDTFMTSWKDWLDPDAGTASQHRHSGVSDFEGDGPDV